MQTYVTTEPKIEALVKMSGEISRMMSENQLSRFEGWSLLQGVDLLIELIRVRESIKELHDLIANHN